MWLKNVDNFQITKVQPGVAYKSVAYKKSVYKSLLRLDEVNVDIDERFQEQLLLEKAENCQMLLTILRCV